MTDITSASRTAILPATASYRRRTEFKPTVVFDQTNTAVSEQTRTPSKRTAYTASVAGPPLKVEDLQSLVNSFDNIEAVISTADSEFDRQTKEGENKLIPQFERRSMALEFPEALKQSDNPQIKRFAERAASINEMVQIVDDTRYIEWAADHTKKTGGGRDDFRKIIGDMADGTVTSKVLALQREEELKNDPAVQEQVRLDERRGVRDSGQYNHSPYKDARTNNVVRVAEHLKSTGALDHNRSNDIQSRVADLAKNVDSDRVPEWGGWKINQRVDWLNTEEGQNYTKKSNGRVADLRDADAHMKKINHVERNYESVVRNMKLNLKEPEYNEWAAKASVKREEVINGAADDLIFGLKTRHEAEDLGRSVISGRSNMALDSFLKELIADQAEAMKK